MDSKNLSVFQVLKILLPYFWPKDNLKIKFQVTFAFIFTLLIIGLYTYVPFVYRRIVELLSTKPITNARLVYLFLITYGFLWTFSQISSILRSTAIIRPLENGARLFSLKLFDHLQSLSIRFHAERKTGAIVNVLSRAQAGFDSFFWNIFLFLLPTTIELILAASILGYYYGKLYIIVLSFVAICYLGFSLLTIKWITKAQTEYNEKDKAATAKLVDSLINAETVKYFNNEKFEHDQANQQLKLREQAAIKRDSLNYIIRAVQWSGAGIGITLLTINAGRQVVNGSLNIGDFVLINSYLLQFTLPLIHFGHVLNDTRRNLTNINNAIELLQVQPEIKDKPNAFTLKADTAEIKFRDVSFGYNKNRPILKDVSFTIPQGKSLALVGPTGSGKSTITKLLYRFYDIDSGSITINDVDIRDVTQDSLRQLMGVVSQDVVLFNNTIYYNIAYAKPGATKEQVEQAIKLANLENLIKRLPEGYNTQVGERGLKLSGGERQRIGIARVLLKKPVIYIFDEATSALDTATEREIQKNLEEISAGSTSVTIAHRLSTVVHANQIIVLVNGVVVEKGTHEELLAKNGEYKKLWLKQVQSND